MAKSGNKLLQIIIDIVVFIILIIVLFLMYRLISLKILNKPYVDFFGISSFEIATGSMEPTLNVKDIIFVKREKEYKKKDIITYLDGKDMITHRIIDVRDSYVITKGDANNSIDTKVDKENIIGKVAYVIPKGGLIRETFVTPKVIISLILTLVLINVFLSLKNKPNTNKEKQGVEENKKKTNEVENLFNELDTLFNPNTVKKNIEYEKMNEDERTFQNLFGNMKDNNGGNASDKL